MNRRDFLKYTAISSGFLISACGKSPEAVASLVNEQRINNFDIKFIEWTKHLKHSTGHNLYSYMSISGKHDKSLSIVASCKLLLYFLKKGLINNATEIADGLVHFQRISSKNTNITKGGLPSSIEYKNKNWELGGYYYSSDNLLTIYALLETFKVTNTFKYADVAFDLYYWMEKTLFNGKGLAGWKKEYGPAMHLVNSQGAFVNHIYTAGDFMWLEALNSLHKYDKSIGFNDRLKLSVEFYKQGQRESGSWYDYFKPDEKQGKWYGYQGNDITIGDNNLRTAIAAQKFNMTDSISKFENWLQPFDDSLLWGYLTTSPKSQPNFLPQDKPYFDIVCTGLLRSYYRKRGFNELANKCQKLVNSLQESDGGYTWGVFQNNLKPLNNEKAIITGCWSMVDIL